MAIQAALSADARTITGKAVRHLRRQGILPANLTGYGNSPLAIQVQAADVDRMLKAFGRTTVIQLSVSSLGAPRTAMLGAVQRDPISGSIKHIDFIQVDLTQKMRASITLHLAGEAAATKNGAGMVLQLLNQIEVEALPDDLPETIVLDISGLAQVDDAVYVRDVKLPAGVVALAEPDSVIARVAHTRATLEAVAQPVEVAAPGPGGAPTE